MRPRAFYVTVRGSRGQTIYALGPFARHSRALGLVEAVRRAITRAELDPWCEFGYGTASMPASSSCPRGALCDAFSVGPDMPHGATQRLAPAVLDRIRAARAPSLYGLTIEPKDMAALALLARHVWPSIADVEPLIRAGLALDNGALTALGKRVQRDLTPTLALV